MLVCLGLQHGTERLREWMASRLLKPLVKAIDGAHTRVIETAARIGWQGVQLQPLEGQAGESRINGGGWDWETSSGGGWGVGRRGGGRWAGAW